jgi:DNA-directed RNA polymerase subunit RPC12/RpoP
MADLRLRKPEPLDRIRNAVYLLAACGAIVGLGIWIGPVFPAVVAAGGVVILASLVRWHASTTGYRCPNCGAEFAISAWADFLSPHMVTSKYVKCRACGQRAWMEALVRE